MCLLWFDAPSNSVFTNPIQNSFSYVLKGREYERQNIILESDPYITTAITRCWIFSIWWWVPLPSASSARLYKCPTFHLNPLSRELWFWHNWLLPKCCKPLHACPSTLRNTCFKFVCLPLPRFSSFPSIPSSWSLGMFTMKLVFQDSSSFLSGNSKSSILFEACSVICIPCLHFSFPLPLQRKAGDSRSEALGAQTHASPGCRAPVSASPQWPRNELLHWSSRFWAVSLARLAMKASRFSDKNISLVFKRLHDNYYNLYSIFPCQLSEW